MQDPLIDTLINLTGLPPNVCKPRLIELLEKSGKDITKLNLDDIREVLYDLLVDMTLEN